MDLEKLKCIQYLIFVATFASPSFAYGRVDYNDECEFPVTDTGTGVAITSEMREWKMCNTERGLFCVPGLGRCGCYVPHTIYRSGKCRAKVNNACLSLDNIRLDCVEDAICNNTGITWKCQCKKGYLSNVENTSCFYASEATKEWREWRNCRYNMWSSSNYWCNHSTSNHSTNFMYLVIVIATSIFLFVANQT